MSYDPEAVAAQEHESWQRSADLYIENTAPMTAASGQVPILCEIGHIDRGSDVLELGLWHRRCLYSACRTYGAYSRHRFRGEHD